MISLPKELRAKRYGRFVKIRQQRGFTLVEVLVITPIIMVTVVSILAFLFTMYGQFVQKNEEANMQVEAQTAIFAIKDDILESTNFLTTQNSDNPDSYSPWPAWWLNFESNDILISQMPTVTEGRRSTTRKKVYYSPGTATSCPPYVTQAVMETYEPAYNNVVYFASGGTLYRRILPPQGGVTCGTGYMVKTCPAANATPTCPPDKILATSVTSFRVSYFRGDGLSTSTPENARRVTLTVDMQKTIAGDPITATATISVKATGE